MIYDFGIFRAKGLVKIVFEILFNQVFIQNSNKYFFYNFKRPIDLSFIQSKVNNKSYKSRELFKEDLQLIVSNCCLYNGLDSCKSLFSNITASCL